MQKFLELDTQGVIPGPKETEEAFLARVEAVQETRAVQEGAVPAHHWTWASEQLKKLFDFSPHWCSASYSSTGLAPWQAAATWIDVKRVYTIQLRASGWVSWLIDRDEVLAHEAVHAARAAFDEPRYEEMFAYLTSSAKWRRVLGPILRKPIEAIVLMGFVGMGSFCQVMGWVLLGLLCYSGALGMCMAGSLRLLRDRLFLKRAAEAALPLLRDPGKVSAFLFRLTDEEILALARGKPLIPKEELRWRLLQEKYLWHK